MDSGVFCFRNDLRLHDNEALELAVSQCDRVILVYCFEDRLWLAKKPKRISTHRAQFILDSLQCLQIKINKSGGTLHFIHGNIEVALPSFMKEVGAQLCFLSEENAWEEKQAEIKLSKIVDLRTCYHRSLIHLEDLTFDFVDFPRTFTKFRKLVEKDWYIRSLKKLPLSIPEDSYSQSKIPALEDFGFNKNIHNRRSYFDFKGGTDCGYQRIHEWIWEKKCILNYKKTRNQLIGSEYSSRFSPWLSMGCLSAKEIYWSIRDFESKYEANESTYWMIFELLWRDFFQFSARLHGAKIFQIGGIHPERSKVPEPSDAEDLFIEWKNGTTKNSFINANMNELRMTGWMSNRGRQNVASYLINELNLNWTRGAQWFEEQLIDYDPCSNYGNWLYLSGFGNDPRENRRFNISKQTEMYDLTGNYTKEWT